MATVGMGIAMGIPMDINDIVINSYELKWKGFEDGVIVRGAGHSPPDSPLRTFSLPKLKA